jgi:hypothetical protein
LSAYRLAAPWWLAVAVSAVAPAVLRAIVHLAVLTSRTRTDDPERDVEPSNDPARHDETPDADPVTELIESGAGRRRLARELDISEHQARQLLAERNGAAQ